jgi:hypothetical protein
VSVKLHTRYQIVARARNRLSEFVLTEQAEGDITATEMLGILLTLAGDQQRFLLREERHPGGDKKADEE